MANLSCDIFCCVIDNHGDIGVCWRLARQLQVNHGWQVRLWVDDPAALPPLLSLPGDTFGIAVQAWTADFPETDELDVPDVVIEAFACELPASYLAAMARKAERDQAPAWINLEYLCVEDWGPGFHLQPSPHPQLPLTKHFFVPGILPGTGGLLCEPDLLERQRAFVRPTGVDAALQVFLFCYENPALPELLDHWRDNERAVHCRVAPGKPAEQVAAWLQSDFAPGETVQRGRLTLTALPFVPQAEFDALLWASDINLIRGEDSFARAQWAGLPFVWQIYVQEDAAHLAKLEQFLKLYCAPLEAETTTALQRFSQCWNSAEAPAASVLASAWDALQAQLPTLRKHAQNWREHLILLGNLAENLAIFCQKR